MKSNKSKVKKIATISQKLRITLLVFLVLFFLLIIRLAFLQLVQGASLKEGMYNQLIKSETINPKRGTIYDTTGKALAVSAQVDTVSIDPSSIIVKNDEEATKVLKEKVAKGLSEIFELDYEETLAKVSRESTYATIAKRVENDKIEQLKKWMENEDIYTGINIDEDTKRYYPYENLASSLIGFCGDSNQGLEGIELAWDDVLTGTPGKIVTAKDAIQEDIPYDNETYIPAENGNDITLTIDANVQSVVEKYLEQACIENECSRGGSVIVMSPKTGDVLAMASYPDYNLNTPFDMPSHISESKWKKMSSNEKTDTLNNLYRNRAISDTYEPGSVFKIITASIALEEDLAFADKANVYNCVGYEIINGVKIKCSHTAGHGKQSLREALENSCNPAFMQLGKKITAATAYKYYDAFGFFTKTGIATSGETNYPIFWNLEDVGPIEVATMSFGQRFKITPLQMITAACSIANDGILMQPRIVKEVKNTDTGAVTTIEPTRVRQVISKETANTMMDMLESVVTDGTGKYAAVKG